MLHKIFTAYPIASYLLLFVALIFSAYRDSKKGLGMVALEWWYGLPILIMLDIPICRKFHFGIIITWATIITSLIIYISMLPFLMAKWNKSGRPNENSNSMQIGGVIGLAIGFVIGLISITLVEVFGHYYWPVGVLSWGAMGSALAGFIVGAVIGKKRF